MILMLDLADRGLTRPQYVAGVRSYLLRTALIDDVTHDISLPTDQEVVRFLKDRGVIRQKAKLHDVTENELHAGREELSAKKKSEAFDERLQGFRASIGIAIVRRSVLEER